MIMNALKKEFLELLDKDIEFRYAIAGYLGLSEILKRLDALAEEQVKLREDLNKIFNSLNTRINRIERTFEKLTVDVEDEARSIIKHRVKQELNIDVELNP